MKALLISPHLDDAVLSAGRFLAANPGSAVVTIFAGIPKDSKALFEYDKKMGFPTSQIAMRVRRSEDQEAIRSLSCIPIQLQYLEEQYRQSEPTYAVALKQLVDLATDYEIVLGPLGIRHPDHVRARNIVNVLATYINKPVYLWADLPYRVTDPGSAWERAGSLQKVGLLVGSKELKLKALQCYQSQWGRDDLMEENVMVAEEFWRLK